jgi:oligo-1,6-glucosidase
MGYDISDYEAVHAPYGTVEDMENLIKACHDRNMRIILDLVVNHTSNEHAWFRASRSSKSDPKRNWYIWRPPQYDSAGNRLPPNNWRSNFGGSAWTYDEGTDEYYLHLFASEQPDLNWENEETREAIYDSAMRFWLDKGVDGFRVDTVNMYSKGSDMPDAPIVDPSVFDQPAQNLFCNGPRMHEFLREMNTKVLDHYDTMTVGELPNTPDPLHVIRYVGASDKQLSMVFRFDLVDLGCSPHEMYKNDHFTLQELKTSVMNQQSFIEGTDGWTTAFCENHDQGRSISRFASDAPEHRVASAKMLATLMTTMTGTLFVYQGQEIGMVNCPDDWDVDEFKDISAINHYHDIARRSGGDEAALQKAMEGLQRMGRHNSRTPMQWDGSAHSGFTIPSATPWMRVHDNYPEINVKSQAGDKESVLNFWTRMISLRKEYRDVFVHGTFKVFDFENDETFVYTKEAQNGGKRALVALNFTNQIQKWERPKGRKWEGLKLLLKSGEGELSSAEDLGPYEARVYVS